MIRTMIVHDVTLISDLLTTVLEDQGDICVVGRRFESDTRNCQAI